MYTDDFISTGVNDSRLFADSIIHRADGVQQVYVNCTKLPGGPVRTQMPMFYADGTNSFSRVLVDYFELAFRMGADGIFHDEFPLSAVAYTYLRGTQRWDGRSVFLEPRTLAVRAVVSSLVLLTQRLELRLLEIVRKHAGLMIMNGAPQTRTWFEAVVSMARAKPGSAPINENENSVAWRALHTQLYTPIQLNRYGGNLYDNDPHYNHTHCCGDSRTARLRYMSTNPCLSVMEHLDFGTLSMGYGGLWSNGSAPNVYATMVPTTSVEIGEGFVVGIERTVTKRSGVWSPPASTHRYTRSRVYLYADCLLADGPRSASLNVSLTLTAGQLAVIVWS